MTHRALSYDPGGTLIGLAVIGEEVMEAKKGDTYTGTFTLDFFDSLGHNMKGFASRRDSTWRSNSGAFLQLPLKKVARRPAGSRSAA